MNTQSSNRVNMVRTVLNFCADNTAKTAGITAFAGVKTTADNKLVLIDQLDQLVIAGSEGVTLNIKVLRVTMCNIALKCGNAVSAYATSIGDFELKRIVTYTLPSLNALKKEEVANVCQGIRDAANTHIAAAGAYGYVAADVTDLQTAIDLYRSSMQDPRDRIVEISQAVANINSLIREVIDDNFKGKLDRMVSTLNSTYPEFVSGYFQRRIIVNIGSTTAKVRGYVHELGGPPLSNVKFTIYETGTTNIVKQVVTDAEGKFNATPLLPGDYDFKWELHGYKTIEETNVHISAGKEVNRKLEMKVGGVSMTFSGDVAAGAVANTQIGDLNITGETTMRLSGTGSTLRFYASTSNTGAPGAQYFEVAPGEIYNKTIGDWITLFGFDNDMEDFLNVFNAGTEEGHWEMKFENLGG